MRRDFPPIFVINLRRTRARRDSVGAAFAELGLEFEFVDAVDGSTLTPAQRACYSQWRALFEMGRPMGRGMLGCSLSHLGVYERMSREQIEVAAVFEDDIAPGPELPILLSSLSALPTDWQVFTLHSLFPSSSPRPIPGPPIIAGHRVCTYARVPFGTQGYAITLSGARRALDVGYPVAFPPDELLFRRRPAGLRVYGIEPSVLVHRGVDSEIHAQPLPVVPDRRVRRPVERLVVVAGKVSARARSRLDSFRRT